MPSIFLCVHIPSAIKVTEFRTIPMKLRLKQILNVKFSGQKWPKAAQRFRQHEREVAIIFSSLTLLMSDSMLNEEKLQDRTWFCPMGID